MIEYKLKASVLVFSLLVTLTGSIVTIEDWEQLNIRQKIEIIETNTSLDEEEKDLLTDMLASDEDEERMKNVISAKAAELRLEASKTYNPVKKIKLKDAADAFEKSLKKLSRIRNYEKTIKNLQQKLVSRDYTPELKRSIENSINKILIDYEKQKAELKLFLVQGFIAVKAANNAERILEEKEELVKETKPKPGDLGIPGLITLVLGILGSIIAGLKLIIDYKRAQIDLRLGELKLKQAEKLD